MGNNDTFGAIFFTNEYRELAGPRHKVTLLLAFLLLLTFGALGFALGGYEQLRTRMQNPFTRWVDIGMGGKAAQRRVELAEFLGAAAGRGRYDLIAVNDWTRYFLEAHDRRHDPLTERPAENAYPFIGRTVGAYDDALFQEVIRPDLGNLLYRAPALTEDDDARNNCGVVVTADMMQRLGYNDPEEYPTVTHISFTARRAEEQTLVPLYAVVESVPSRADFISFSHLYNVLQGDNPELLKVNPELLETNGDYLRPGPRYLLGREGGRAGALKDDMADHFGRPRNAFGITESTWPVDGERSYTLYEISPADGIPEDSTTSWLTTLTAGADYADYAYCDCGERAGKMERADHRTLDFARLDSIRAFQAALEKEVGLKISMEQIENRENFNLVARLTGILSITLFMFGLLSIVLYLVNLLNNHVDKIRPHLGTLKAMGLPNGRLLWVYTRITLRLLMTATAIALPLALLLGGLLDRYALAVGFTLRHFAIPVAILIILLVVCLLVRYRLRSIFATTPGDLIYERQ